jgi:hypothetical protein
MCNHVDVAVQHIEGLALCVEYGVHFLPGATLNSALMFLIALTVSIKVGHMGLSLCIDPSFIHRRPRLDHDALA